jgi:phosphoribosylamine--glycine ligase
MMVSGGYPGVYDKGKVIKGLEDVAGSMVFHAGTGYGAAAVREGGTEAGERKTKKDEEAAVSEGLDAVGKSESEAAKEEVVTAGGRVLAISSFGDSISQARDLSYQNAGKIVFDGKYIRNDIGIDLMVGQ